jgi:hypothetical protein
VVVEMAFNHHTPCGDQNGFQLPQLGLFNCHHFQLPQLGLFNRDHFQLPQLSTTTKFFVGKFSIAKVLVSTNFSIAKILLVTTIFVFKFLVTKIFVVATNFNH